MSLIRQNIFSQTKRHCFLSPGWSTNGSFGGGIRFGGKLLLWWSTVFLLIYIIFCFVYHMWLFGHPSWTKKKLVWRNANQDKMGLAYCKYGWEVSDNCEMSRTAGIFQCPTWISAEEIFISWLTLLAFTHYLNTVGSLKDWTNRSVWSKTTLITGGVGGKGWILPL